MEFHLNYKIFSKLPLEIVDIIMSLYYGPLDIDIYQKKKELNTSIKSTDIYLNLANDDSQYDKVPELFEHQGDIWYDYIHVHRLPKLEKADYTIPNILIPSIID